jgi:hypothetical protein
VPPFGVPRIANFCFWAGLYGAAFGLALPRLPRAPMWLLGLGLGLLATLVLWFVVAPLKGQPVAGATHEAFFMNRRVPEAAHQKLLVEY